MSNIPSSAPKASPSNDAEARRHDELWNSVYNILKSYLQDNSILSLDEAVDQVNQCWDDKTKYNVAVLVVVVYIAKKTPYYSSTHKKLADFVQALDRKRGTLNPPSDDRMHSLGNFTLYLYDNVEEPEDLVNDPEDPDDPIVYANFCAFLANLVFANGEFLREFPVRALNGATKVDPTSTAEIRDAWVIGAAQFILYQAPAIFKEVLRNRKRQDQLSRSLLARLGIRKREPEFEYSQFTSDDWQAWRRAFKSAAADDTHGETCREIAHQAADLMALQEKIEDDRSTQG